MHHDEIDVDADLVRSLLETQFPQWAHLPLERVREEGTDNAIFRLGDDKSVRLPKQPEKERTLELEAEWLPRLAPRLPFARGGDSRLAGVLDWGVAAAGEPAADVAAGIKILPPDEWNAFRGARARGWVAQQCAGALTYYTDENNPALMREARRWLDLL